MSRSRKKYPCTYIVAWSRSNKPDKKLHNHIIRNKWKKYLSKISTNVENADNMPIKFKKEEGLNIYCFQNDGGNIWWIKDRLSSEQYKKLFRK